MLECSQFQVVVKIMIASCEWDFVLLPKFVAHLALESEESRQSQVNRSRNRLGLAKRGRRKRVEVEVEGLYLFWL